MIQFISHLNERYDYLDGISMALKGGCSWIQLRMKGYTDDEVRPIAMEAQRMCRRHKATFIIDDRVELVKELKADGVHLGLKDMPVAQARELLGPGFIIGGTANTFEDVRMHWQGGASYIGCGPFRFTTTKEGLSPILGIEGYREIVSRMKAEGIELPIVAIGGITPEDIPEIMATGVSGIALSGTILRAQDPVAMMRNLNRIINRQQ